MQLLNMVRIKNRRRLRIRISGGSCRTALIKIDQVRALNAFAVQTPQIAKRKVAAVFDAHLLNVNAANTLLKTLEEPPQNTHILLCTHIGAVSCRPFVVVASTFKCRRTPSKLETGCKRGCRFL